MDMDAPKTTTIKVLGLGGGGSNAVDRMIELGLEGVEFIAANTDAQALHEPGPPIQLGPNSARSLRRGSSPRWERWPPRRAARRSPKLSRAPTWSSFTAGV